MDNPELLKRVNQLLHSFQLALNEDIWLPPADQALIVMHVDSLLYQIDLLKDQGAAQEIRIEHLEGMIKLEDYQ